ncbi:unnamed protein product [Notodromas monacha]|uniref:C2H2-type domain-containing protein n=1 Tax=Notodromas monacha TaxID=399045 RepID=A0A7R9GHY5_9CRUS|nr:unnamed protein product [Notodromas monacha]CAG0923289.1 unnamed protein product [Notodromas monacha]
MNHCGVHKTSAQMEDDFGADESDGNLIIDTDTDDEKNSEISKSFEGEIEKRETVNEANDGHSLESLECFLERESGDVDFDVLEEDLRVLREDFKTSPVADSMNSNANQMEPTTPRNPVLRSLLSEKPHNVIRITSISHGSSGVVVESPQEATPSSTTSIDWKSPPDELQQNWNCPSGTWVHSSRSAEDNLKPMNLTNGFANFPNGNGVVVSRNNSALGGQFSAPAYPLPPYRMEYHPVQQNGYTYQQQGTSFGDQSRFASNFPHQGYYDHCYPGQNPAGQPALPNRMLYQQLPPVQENRMPALNFSPLGRIPTASHPEVVQNNRRTVGKATAAKNGGATVRHKRKFVCAICHQRLLSFETWSQHMVKKHQKTYTDLIGLSGIKDGLHECKFCGRKFNTTEWFHFHVCQCHGEPVSPMRQCNFCKQVFPWDSFGAHLRISHQVNVSIGVMSDPLGTTTTIRFNGCQGSLICAICKIQCSNADLLREHLNKHSEELCEKLWNDPVFGANVN